MTLAGAVAIVVLAEFLLFAEFLLELPIRPIISNVPG